MRKPAIRFALVASTLSATLAAACNDSTAPAESGRAWWEGTWIAVRGNDQPLPFSSARETVVREIVLILNADSTKPSKFLSNGTRTESFRIIENPVDRTVQITPTDTNLRLYDGPKATIGQLDLTFRRLGDTLLLPSYSAGQFKLVRTR